MEKIKLQLCLICSNNKVEEDQESINCLLEREFSDGDNPSSWIGFCSDCHAIINKAEMIFQEMLLAKKKLSECQRLIVAKIKSSTSKPVGNRNFGKEQSSQIGDTICDFVKKHQYSWSDDDPSAGDRMAKQLFDFKLQTVNQESVTTTLAAGPQIKEEISPITDEESNEPGTDFEDDIDIDEETVMQIKVERTNHNSQPTGIYQCKHCDKWYNTQQQLSSHRHDAHDGGRKTVKCPHCDFTSQRIQSIKRHVIRMHEKTRNFTCDLCDKKLILLEDLRYHQALSHHKCSVKDCFLICESQLHLREHQVNCHGKEINVFQCSECEKLLSLPGELRKHLKKQHGKWVSPQRKYKRKIVKKIPETNSVCKCDKCNSSFSDAKQLKRHVYNVHVRGNKVLKCDQCDFVARRSDLLKGHKTRVHEKTETELVCGFCGEKSEFENRFRYHQVWEHKKCSTSNCDVVCETHKELRDHQVNSHGKELDLFECPDCGKLLSKRPYLVSHRRKVHGKKVKTEGFSNPESILGI